jgi:hypothetical protein
VLTLVVGSFQLREQDMMIGYSIGCLGRGLTLASLVAAAGLGQPVHSAMGQTYPTRIIKMIVPFAPAGSRTRWRG